MYYFYNIRLVFDYIFKLEFYNKTKYYKII